MGPSSGGEDMTQHSVTVVVDTREQRPWAFSDRVWAVRSKLDVGDYSIKGLEKRVTIERKSLDEFVRCCSCERTRFIRELDRLHKYKFSVIVVEASWPDVVAHAYRSTAAPDEILEFMFEYHDDYDVPTIFEGDPR